MLPAIVMPRAARYRPFLVVLVIAAVVGLAIWFASGSFLGAPSTATNAPALRSDASVDRAASTLEQHSHTNTAETTSPREPAATTTAPRAPRLQGRVVDSGGRALAGVPIAWVGTMPFVNSDAARRVQASDCNATSDTQGHFTVDAPERGAVPTAGPGWCTLRATDWTPRDGEARELLVVAAKCVDVTGRITRADDGMPLAGAMVHSDLMFLRDFPSSLEHTCAPLADIVLSAANGDYRLAHAPLAAGVDLLFTCDGFQPRRVPDLEAASGRLDVALVPATDRPGHIHGRAYDGQGPAADAHVQLGFDQTTDTDARGEFTFAFPSHPSRLIATRRGWQPIVRERIGADTPEIELAFERRALAIAGVVQYADGSPAVGFHLDLVDAIRGLDHRPVELASRDASSTAECFATTDARGHFVVDGLADRTYQLLAYEPKSLIVVTSAPIAAGTHDVVLTVPADSRFDLRGLVVDRRDAPVAGASLHAWLAPASQSQPVGGPRTSTAADGRFVLANMPRCGVQLGVSKEGWVDAVRPIEVWTRDGTDVRVVMERLCSVRIEGEANLVVQFLDADGRPVHAECHSQTTVFSSDAVTLRNGKSPVMSVPESTATMVWRRGDKELGRKSVFVDPAPDAVTLLVAAN